MNLVVKGLFVEKGQSPLKFKGPKTFSNELPYREFFLF